jgi:6-phosphofructokinase
MSDRLDPSKIHRVAINTGGGDAPGLNAVIRAATLASIRKGWEVFGINHGYRGLFDMLGLIPLTRERVRRDINSGNPFRFAKSL